MAETEFNCPRCGGKLTKDGQAWNKEHTFRQQRYKCVECKSNVNESVLVAKQEQLPKSLPNESFDLIPTPEPTPTTNRPLGITKAQLRMKYDMSFIIKEKCKQLQPDQFLTNAEFVQFCGFSAGMRYKDAMEHPEFEQYHGKAYGGVIYWSTAESIAEMKRGGTLM